MEFPLSRSEFEDYLLDLLDEGDATAVDECRAGRFAAERCCPIHEALIDCGYGEFSVEDESISSSGLHFFDAIEMPEWAVRFIDGIDTKFNLSNGHFPSPQDCLDILRRIK